MNFGTRTFTYRTLNSAAQEFNVAGTATLTPTQLAAGTVTSDAFTVTPRGEGGITAEFRGRAGGLWQAISGVFATNTDSGLQYAGGFVAYLHDRATAVNAAAGIGRIDGIRLESGDRAAFDHALFAANNVTALINAENDLPTRSAGILSSITPDLSGATPAAQGAAAGHALKLTRNFNFDSRSVSADIYFDRGRAARLLVLHGASNSPVVSAIVAGGSAFSGTLSGAYTYVGAYLYAAKATAHDTTTGNFELTASFAGGRVSAFSLSGTTPAGANASSLVFTPAGTTATISGARFSATGGFFKKGSGTAGSGDQSVILHGIFSGAGGQAISGVFATTSGATAHLGGFVGGGKSDVETVLDPVSGRASGIGVLAGRNLGSGADGVAFAGEDYAALVAGTTAANDTARGNAFLAGLSPSGFGAVRALSFGGGFTHYTEGRANTRTGGAYNSGGSFPATEWTNQGGQARLVLFDGSGVTGAGVRGSFLAAGGASRPASGVLVGGFTWSGAVVLGRAGSLNAGIETGRFQLRYDFAGAGAGTLEGLFNDLPGNSSGTATRTTLTVGVLIDAASGAISSPTGRVFSLSPSGGSTFGGDLTGYVSGAAAQGISGVFATNGASGTQYVGGFVGGAPVLARVLANPANGLRIGTAREGVGGTSGAGRGSLFLDASDAAFDTHTSALNTVSNTARGNALLLNLRDTLIGGTPVPDTVITKYTLSSGNKITYGTSEATSGVVFGDSGLGLRLVAADGFIAVGGTLLTAAITGRFEYAGAFVSSAGGSFAGEIRDGKFDLVAELSGADSTHYFTLDAQTVNAGGTVTSQLDVTQANGGTINATTGVFSATAASFIEGAGSTGGIPALVHGRILSAGAGVAGLFTTTQAGTVYAGGFAGAVLNLAEAYTTTPGYSAESSAGFIESNRIAIAGEQVGATFLFAHNATGLVSEANSTTTATRDGAFLAKAGAATGFTNGAVTDLTNGFSSTSVTGPTYDGDGAGTGNAARAIPLTVITDRFGIARFAHVSSAGQSGSAHGSFVIAGGAELTGTRTGAYQWTGHLSYGEVIAFTSVTTVATSISTQDINAASPTLTFTIPSSANAVGLTGTLSLDKATGVLTNGTNGGASTLRFQTADLAPSKGAAVFAGRLHGPGGISLAGVFASTGTQIDEQELGRRGDRERRVRQADAPCGRPVQRTADHRHPDHRQRRLCAGESLGSAGGLCGCARGLRHPV